MSTSYWASLYVVFHSFQEIPSVGIDKWFQLEGRSARSNVEGSIRLHLRLATREDRGIPEEDNWTDIKQHEDLMSIFIEHEIRKFRVRHRVRWGVFSIHLAFNTIETRPNFGRETWPHEPFSVLTENLTQKNTNILKKTDRPLSIFELRGLNYPHRRRKVINS